ncbi:hypothetical protein AX14_004713 [Amanita brunnescens Koide BX004]|nr:hypothetical protein AX14_004713 [Amanita brunnescens Koide BX004]
MRTSRTTFAPVADDAEYEHCGARQAIKASRLELWVFLCFVCSAQDDQPTRPSLKDRISYRQPSLEEYLASAPVGTDSVDDNRPPHEHLQLHRQQQHKHNQPSRTNTLRDKPPYYHDEQNGRGFRASTVSISTSTKKLLPTFTPRDYEGRNEKARYPPAVAPPPPPSAPSRDRERDGDWHYQQPSGPGSYCHDLRDRERDWLAPPIMVLLLADDKTPWAQLLPLPGPPLPTHLQVRVHPDVKPEPHCRFGFESRGVSSHGCHSSASNSATSSLTAATRPLGCSRTSHPSSVQMARASQTSWTPSPSCSA